jgi:putative PIN family toxin of toxin-antitoxin system
MSPLRIVLDANVVISALIRPDSVPGRILSAAIAGTTVRAIVSEPLLEELHDALQYPRLQRHLKMTATAAAEFILLLEQVTEPVRLADHPAPGICRDPDDEPYLQTALAGRAEYIVSGDRDLLALAAVEHIPIITPSAFWRLVQPPT